MSKLKNIFGLPESLIQAASSIHEKSNELKGNQHKIDVAEPKGKITKADFDKLRAKKYNISPSEYDDPISKSKIKTESSEGFSKDMANANKAEIERLKTEKDLRKAKKQLNSEETLNEIGDTPKGQEKLINVVKRRQKQGYVTHNDPVQKQAAKRLDRSAEKIYKEEISLDEKKAADALYPFKTNQITLFTAQLRSLLDYLSKFSPLKKIMRDEVGLDLDVFTVDALMEVVDVLNEGRGRPRKNPEASTQKTSNDEEPDTYEKAGDDGRNMISSLAGAKDLPKGGSVPTSKGDKHVSSKHASHLHSHLMSLKPSDRAKAASDLYHGRHELSHMIGKN